MVGTTVGFWSLLKAAESSMVKVQRALEPKKISLLLFCAQLPENRSLPIFHIRNGLGLADAAWLGNTANGQSEFVPRLTYWLLLYPYNEQLG